jgi:hypothetical protein
MSKEESIKYLQQLYPNGGHCWLDEQRIEAIGLAIKALYEEPVSEDLEEAIGECCSNPDNFATWIGGKDNDDIPLIIKAIKFGAKWQKQQMLTKAINTKASLTMSVPCICISLPLGVNVGDKVKVIVIKED